MNEFEIELYLSKREIEFDFLYFKYIFYYSSKKLDTVIKVCNRNWAKFVKSWPF